MPFKVIQGHRFRYQSKAHIDLLLVINTNLPPFPSYSFWQIQNRYIWLPSCV